jgi:pyrimidine-specific ribonucleoside hydrolase
MARPVILDVDTGTDDAMALMFAVAHPGLDLLGVSCVAGNVPLAQVVDNTRRILDAAGAPAIPVAAGAVRPLIQEPRPASHVHGASGLGGLRLPPSSRRTDPAGAVDMMRREILASAEPVTLIALAPQTNLALLLRVYPEVTENLREIVFMGGSAGRGNATAVAEFNVWHDPEAAHIVASSGVPLRMYGLDVFEEVRVAERRARALAKHGSSAEKVVGQLLAHRPVTEGGAVFEHSGLIGDAGAVCLTVIPEAFLTERHAVEVNLVGPGRGQTIVDRRTEFDAEGTRTGTEMEVALGVDSAAVVDAFLEAIGSLPSKTAPIA